jgi:hypothetical protein
MFEISPAGIVPLWRRRCSAMCPRCGEPRWLARSHLTAQSVVPLRSAGRRLWHKQWSAGARRDGISFLAPARIKTDHPVCAQPAPLPFRPPRMHRPGRLRRRATTHHRHCRQPDDGPLRPPQPHCHSGRNYHGRYVEQKCWRSGMLASTPITAPPRVAGQP